MTRKRMWPHYVLFVALVVACIVVDSRAFASTAHWKMNEHRHSHVLRDSAHHFNGHIGKHVAHGHGYHHFPLVRRSVVRPGHIDTVPNTYRLEPGGRRFSVAVQFRWARGKRDTNLIQKGQGDPVGGMFKMKTTVNTQPLGQVKCLFRGSAADSQVDSYGHKRLDDGRWHRVRCWMDGHGTHLAVDGKVWDHNPRDPGIISNDWPIAIGGNTYCPSEQGYQCNYWHGDIGDIEWRVG